MNEEEFVYIQKGLAWCFDFSRIRSRRRGLSSFILFCTALQKRGFWLNGGYNGVSNVAEVMCPQGHALKIRPTDFHKGIGCSYCSGKRADQSKQKTSDLANKLGFTIVVYGKNSKDLTEMICPKGHTLHIRPNNFLNGWRCAKCSEKCRMQANEGFVSMINREGYKIVIDGETSLSEATIECPKGHVFKTTPSRFKKGGRCPNSECRHYIREALCRTVFERLFQEQFPKINGKKSFIKSLKTDRHLELDGYSDKLKIAFEYQGEQHYKAIARFGNNISNIQKIDRYKAEQCKIFGVSLLQIPHYKLRRNMDKAEIDLTNLIIEWAKKNNLIHLLQNPPSSGQKQ